MSQAHNSRDNQALLQSMLQRLKLQAGTTDIQSGQNVTTGQNIHSETNVNNNPMNGFEPTDNRKTELTVNGKLRDLEDSFGDSGASGHRQDREQGSQSAQCFLPKSVYTATSPVSSEGSLNLSNSGIKGVSQSQSTEEKKDQDSGFVPKIYKWSIQNTEAQNNKAFFEGVQGVTGQNTQTVTNNQNTTSRKQRSSENKTHKWTQKIKEKWRDRPGSFGKKDRLGDKLTQENSRQHQQSTLFYVPSVEEPRDTPTLEDRTDHVQIQTSNGNDESMRSTTEFDLGLGSFSLLDEIVSGQEWAKFLNPVAATVQKGPSQETTDQTLTSYQDEKSGIKSMLNEHHVGTNTNIFGKSREASSRDIAMTQVSPEPPSHISMDITAQTQLEPMDHGQSQSDMQVTASVDQPQRQHSTQTEIITMDKSSLRDRLSLSRKRQHQSYEIIQAKFQRVAINGNDTVDDASVFLPDNHVMNNTDGKPMSFFLSPTKLSSPVPRGVLKSTMSCDSNYSVETIVKKRRMDVTRHVHFSEEIIAIEPPELGPDMFESEEEEGEVREEEEDEEEDSFLEEDSEELSEPTFLGPVRPEQVAPPRRSALPAWIRALKRKKKKERKKPR